MKVKLGEVAEIIMGQSPDSSSYNYEDGLPFFQGNADFGEYYPTIRILCNKPKKIANKYDVLISVRAPVGAVNIANNICAIGRGLAIIRTNANTVNHRYLFYLLKYHRRYIENLGTGSTFKAISKPILNDLCFTIHDIQTQKEIVAVLDKVTSLISMRKEQLGKLDVLVKSKFIEMFGDPVLNPKGWEKKKLGNYISLISGYAFTNNDYNNSGIPVIKIGNINSGYFEPKNLNYVQENVKLNKYLVYPYDIVISLTGTVGKNDYGNLCILPSIYDKYYLNQRNAKLELINHLDKYFLYHIFKFEHIKKSLTKISRGIRQANISNNDILNLQLPIPPLDIQNQFAEFVEQVEKNKENIKSSLNQLETLYSALMQEYFG